MPARGRWPDCAELVGVGVGVGVDVVVALVVAVAATSASVGSSRRHRCRVERVRTREVAQGCGGRESQVGAAAGDGGITGHVSALGSMWGARTPPARASHPRRSTAVRPPAASATRRTTRRRRGGGSGEQLPRRRRPAADQCAGQPAAPRRHASTSPGSQCRRRRGAPQRLARPRDRSLPPLRSPRPGTRDAGLAFGYARLRGDDVTGESATEAFPCTAFHDSGCASRSNAGSPGGLAAGRRVIGTQASCARCRGSYGYRKKSSDRRVVRGGEGVAGEPVVAAVRGSDELCRGGFGHRFAVLRLQRLSPQSRT